MLITHIVFPLCLQNKPLLLETPNCAQFTQTEALEVQKKKDVRRMKRIEGIPPPPPSPTPPHTSISAQRVPKVPTEEPESTRPLSAIWVISFC